MPMIISKVGLARTTIIKVLSVDENKPALSNSPILSIPPENDCAPCRRARRHRRSLSAAAASSSFVPHRSSSSAPPEASRRLSTAFVSGCEGVCSRARAPVLLGGYWRPDVLS